MMKSSSIENMHNQNLPKNLQQQILELKALKSLNNSHTNLTGMEQVASQPQEPKQDLISQVAKASEIPCKSKTNLMEHVNSFT